MGDRRPYPDFIRPESNRSAQLTKMVHVYSNIWHKLVNCVFFSLKLVFQKHFQTINIPLLPILITQDYGIFFYWLKYQVLCKAFRLHMFTTDHYTFAWSADEVSFRIANDLRIWMTDRSEIGPSQSLFNLQSAYC